MKWLKRYDFAVLENEVETIERNCGDYVLFDEHLEMVKELRETIEEQEEQIEKLRECLEDYDNLSRGTMRVLQETK